MSRLSCDGDQPRTRFTRAARVARASPVAPRAPRPRSARSGDRREDARRPATTGDEEEEERTTAARDVPAELRWVSRQGGYYDPDFESRLSSLRSSRRSKVYIS